MVGKFKVFTSVSSENKVNLLEYDDQDSFKTTEIARINFKHPSCSVIVDPSHRYIVLFEKHDMCIYDLIANKVVFEVSLEGLCHVQISQNSNYVYTWQTFKKTEENNPSDNARFFFVKNIQNKDDLVVGEFGSFSCINYCFREILWGDFGKLGLIITKNHLNFYDLSVEGNLSCNKHDKVNMKQISMSPNKSIICCTIEDDKRGMNFIKLFKYPNLANSSALSSVSFQKSGECTFLWNSKEDCVIVIMSIEDSRKSFYGEKHIYFLNSDGLGCSLTVHDKNSKFAQSLHAVEWNPDGNSFIVIRGNLPAEGYLYNKDADILFTFPKSTKNKIYYNPFGSIVCLTAHGNAHGPVEIWNTKTHKLISQFLVPIKTKVQWTPDGLFIVFATMSPSLTVGNEYQIFDYKGKCHFKESFENLEEIILMKNECFTIYKPPSNIVSPPNPFDYIPKNANKAYVPKGNYKFSTESLITKPTGNVSVNKKTPANNFWTKKSDMSDWNTNKEVDVKKVQRQLDLIKKYKEKLQNGENLTSNQADFIKNEETLLTKLKNLSI